MDRLAPFIVSVTKTLRVYYPCNLASPPTPSFARKMKNNITISTTRTPLTSHPQTPLVLHLLCHSLSVCLMDVAQDQQQHSFEDSLSHSVIPPSILLSRSARRKGNAEFVGVRRENSPKAWLTGEREMVLAGPIYWVGTRPPSGEV